jgi:tripartite-type tricarboxylate transporter receptor subunit TctC
MNLPRRQFLHLTAGAAALPAVARIARAQTYPSRPIRVIVPFAAGGQADILARLIGQWLSERLGQPFVIENRPGGGTNIATEAVVRAPADGYTLLMVGATQAINATLYDKLNFHLIRDITPVAGIIVVPNVMVVSPSVPATTVPEFIASAKANAGKLSMASGGIGSTGHVSGMSHFSSIIRLNADSKSAGDPTGKCTRPIPSDWASASASLNSSS